MKLIGPVEVDVSLSVNGGMLRLAGGVAEVTLPDGTKTKDIDPQFIPDQAYGFGFYQEPAQEPAAPQKPSKATAHPAAE